MSENEEAVCREFQVVKKKNLNMLRISTSWKLGDVLHNQKDICSDVSDSNFLPRDLQYENLW